MPAPNMQASVTRTRQKTPNIPRGNQRFPRTNLRKKSAIEKPAIIQSKQQSAKIIHFPLLVPQRRSEHEEKYFMHANETVVKFLSKYDVTKPEQKATVITMIALIKYLTIKNSKFDQQKAINLQPTSQRELALQKQSSHYAEQHKGYKEVEKDDFSFDTTDSLFWNKSVRDALKAKAVLHLAKGLKAVANRKIITCNESKSQILYCEDISLTMLRDAFHGHISKNAYIEDLGDYLFINLSDQDYYKHELTNAHWFCQCGFKPGFHNLEQFVKVSEIRKIGASINAIKAFKAQCSMLDETKDINRTNFFMCIAKESIRLGKLADRNNM